MFSKRKEPTSVVTQGEAVAAAPTLEALRAKFNQAAEAFKHCALELEQAKRRAADVLEEVAKAEGEANAVRLQWRELLRRNGGEVSSSIHELRATERASFTLIEELNDLASELTRHEKAAELQLAELYSPADIASKALRDRLVEGALKHAIAEFGPRLAKVPCALRLVTREGAETAFLARLERGLDEHRETAERPALDLLAGTEFDSSQVSPNLRRSHMARMSLRRELAGS